MTVVAEVLAGGARVEFVSYPDGSMVERRWRGGALSFVRNFDMTRSGALKEGTILRERMTALGVSRDIVEAIR